MEKRRVRTLLIVATIFFSLGALAGIFPAMFSPMMFDAPGSEHNLTTIVLFLSVLTFPISCLLGIALSWIFYGLNFLRAACWLAFL
ncbi:MAG TPA: hypothetical protein VGI42_00155, partial [Chthoniobacterales bacterium]